MKEEPTHYSFDDLVKDRRTVWNGVKNNLAQKHLRNVKKNDLILYYHTGDEKAAVGVAKFASDPYPDTKANPKLVSVDIAAVEKLKRPVTLAEIKSKAKFKNFELVRIPRLSVMPVPSELWAEIMLMSKS